MSHDSNLWGSYEVVAEMPAFVPETLDCTVAIGVFVDENGYPVVVDRR